MGKISFEKRRAVVTGAGRGIGRAYALELASRGAAVVVNDYNEENAKSVVEEIKKKNGQAVANTESVSTPEGGAAIIQSAVDEFGGVDIVINNAGFLRPGYFEELSIDDIDEVLNVHLRAAFYVTQPAWKLMKAQQYGRVVMTSSNSGMFAHQGNANYAAGKAGVYGLMRALAYEGNPNGIHVNAILPMASTPIGVENPIPDMMEERRRIVGDGNLEKISKAPRGPEMVAHIVAYLASEECDLNGEAFSVCCGRYARVFVAACDGWLSKGDASAENIRDHIGEVRDTEKHKILSSLFDEYLEVAKRL